MRPPRKVTGAMAGEKRAETTAPKPRRTRQILLGIGVILLIGGTFLLYVGRWLVVEDPLEKAQAIVVLSGRMPVRALEAAKLYRNGYAPKIWLTHSTEPGATLGAMGISYTGEEAYNVQVLKHEGVPTDAIRVLEPPIVNTADELEAVSAALTQEKEKTVIIVTTKVHTRRVRILWHRIAKGRGQAIVRAASDDPFVPGRWWRTTGDALDVVREFLGILNAAAGMPLRPAN
jgi:hypothetical protein